MEVAPAGEITPAGVNDVASTVENEVMTGRTTPASETEEIAAIWEMESEPAGEIIPASVNGVASAVNAENEAALAGRITSASELEEIAAIG